MHLPGDRCQDESASPHGLIVVKGWRGWRRPPRQARRRSRRHEREGSIFGAHIVFNDSSARRERAVRRIAPLIGLLYTVLVVWFLEHHGRTFTASLPLRPWYRHKLGLSFADILREARAAISSANILDLINDEAALPVPLPATSSARTANDGSPTVAIRTTVYARITDRRCSRVPRGAESGTACHRGGARPHARSVGTLSGGLRLRFPGFIGAVSFAPAPILLDVDHWDREQRS